MNDFNGVKAALLFNSKLLVYLRDDKPGLRFANMWDFFGGGREGAETPAECLIREIAEELEIAINEDQIAFRKIFPAMHDPTQNAYFMVVILTKRNAEQMHFGSEGQAMKYMTIDEFMADQDVVPLLKPRMQSYLESQDAKVA